MTSTPATPIRVCAVLVNRREVCLIHRRRADGDQYSLPGGLLNTGEQAADALTRELQEELHLDISVLPHPVLRWSLDQATTRPGTGTLFRRLHLVHTLDLPDSLRTQVTATEQDAEDTTRILWVPLDQVAGLHLYPAVGPALADLATTAGDTPVELPAMDDRSYSWR